MTATENVRRLAGEVLELWGDHISTHYEGCWKRHVACFAVLVNDLLNEQEEPDE